MDIEFMKITAAGVLSDPAEISQALRWIALLSDEVSCELAASTGVHDSEGVIKLLLVGARAVQLCSTLYTNGVDYVKTIIAGVEEWMTRHGLEGLDDFRGKLCQERSEHPEVYERSQYIKALVGIS